MTRPMVISKALIVANVPSAPDGEWRMTCPDCAEDLAFAYRDRGTARATLIVTHGAGEARLEIAGRSEATLLWAIGLRDPLGAWLDGVHDYEDGEVRP
jgi:hypothetical protein